MPFTLAHTAAALPFRRLGLVWSALLVGTMAPDLEYFARLSPDSRFGHTLKGALLLSLPLAILTLWLFHKFVKIFVVDLLPEKIGNRVDNQNKFRFGGGTQFALIVISGLIGIATHLIWDSFTHSTGFFVRQWPTLREPANLSILGKIPVYKLLQHGSTVIGTCALAIWLLLWYRKVEPQCSLTPERRINPRQKVLIAVMMTSIAIIGATIRTGLARGNPPRELPQHGIGIFVVTVISVIWWELVLCGAFRRNGVYASPPTPPAASAE
jgi:hypothetical protein